MKVVLENKVLGKVVNIEVCDEFFETLDNVRILAGSECYKLVDTKSAADREREELAMKFANETFPEVMDKEMTDEELTKFFENKLDTTDDYKRLVELSDKKLLLMSFTTGFKRFKAINKNIAGINTQIVNTMLDQNVFFDYALRIKDFLYKVSSLKEYREFMKLFTDMLSYDERIPVGRYRLHETMFPLYEEEERAVAEVMEANKGLRIDQTPIWDDKTFWFSRFTDAITTSKNKVDALLKKWHETADNTPKAPSKFKQVLKYISEYMNPAVVAYAKLKSLQSADNDAVAIEEGRSVLKSAITAFATGIEDVEIFERVIPMSYENVYEEEFIDYVFGAFQDYRTKITERKGSAMFQALITVNSVVQAMLQDKLDPEKFMKQEYTTEELQKVCVDACRNVCEPHK